MCLGWGCSPSPESGMLKDSVSSHLLSSVGASGQSHFLYLCLISYPPLLLQQAFLFPFALEENQGLKKRSKKLLRTSLADDQIE